MNRAAEYGELFRVWPVRANKTPLMRGFGEENPRATWPIDRFRADLPVAILCGPLQPGQADDVHILGLDLDKEMTREKLEAALGCKLPETLTSKGWRHAYYFIPSDHPLHQRNKAIVCEGGALDIRPCAGGYLIEKGDWDRGFDPLLIAELPAQALSKLAQFIGEKRQRDGAPPEIGTIQISDRDTEIAKEISGVWEHHKTGDRALGALGGWLARRGVSRDRAEAIAGLIAELTDSQHPDPLERVAQAYDGACPLGRPALQHALSEGTDEGAVLLTLESVEEMLKESVPGFVPVEEKPKSTIESRFIRGPELALPAPLPNWLIPELEIAPGRPPILSANAGGGKTWGMQALALAVANGLHVFDRFECRKVPVLHISRDSSLGAVKRRYQKLARGMGVDLAKSDLVVFPHRLKLVDKFGVFQVGGFKEVADEAAKGYGLVILDSIASLCAGLDENSVEIAAPLDATKDDACVWWWLHHNGRNGTIRGSSAIMGVAGTWWSIGEGYTWHCEKRSEDADDTETPADFATDWVDVNGGKKITVKDIVQAPKAQKPQKESPETTHARIRNAMVVYLRDRGGSCTLTKMRAELTGPNELIAQVAKSLCEEGTLTFVAAEKKYHLTSGAR